MKNIPRFESCDLLNDKNTQKDFVIFDLRYILSVRKNMISNDHKHKFYQIMFIKNGSGTHTIDKTEYTIAKGDIFFITPGQSHHWNLHDNVDGFVINFTNEFILSFVSKTDLENELPYLKNLSEYNLINVGEHNSRIESIFDKIMYENQLLENSDPLLIKVYLLELLILFKKQIEEHKSFNYKSLQPLKLVKQFETLIEKHFNELRFPKEYAEILNVTPNYLNATCQKVKGQSAGDLIRNRVLLESKRLLISTTMSASEIAYKLSFKDNSYFSRFFKKYVGVAPDEYRRN
ncbi:MAG: AraC family transcriptional regulator [Flavobacteriaceae bacterium]|jgi:AraC-like DNA-binding protein|nr:AraC family transcriptional regulator [Flavobacteriaceae bacterium]